MARRPSPTLTDEAAPVYEAGLVVAAAVPLPAAVEVLFILGAMTDEDADALAVAIGATGVTLAELETGAAEALEMTAAIEDETALETGAAEDVPAAEAAAAPAALGQIC
jgi:hypothetical protein